MFKKTIILLLTALVFTFLYFNLSIKLDVLQKPVRNAISRTQLSDIKFGNIYFKFFNRISINNVSLGNDFHCREIIVYIDPVILVKNIKNPQKALNLFLVDNGTLKLTNELLKKLQSTSSSNGSSGQNTKIILKNIELSFENYKLTDLNGSIIIDKNVYSSISAEFEDKRIAIDAVVSKEKESLRTEISLGILGKEMEIKSSLEALITSDGKINLVARTPRMHWKNISFNDSVLKMNYNNSLYEIKLMNKKCKIYAERKLREDFKLRADLKLDSLIQDGSGKINFNFEINKNEARGDFHCFNIYYLKSFIGDGYFSFKTNPNHSISGKGKMDNPGYVFEGISKNFNEFNVKAKSKGKGLAELKGTYSPLNLIIKVSKWPLDNMPILSGYFPDIMGELAAETEINKNISRTEMFADNLVLRRNKIPSFQMRLIGSKGNWFYKVNSLDKSFDISGMKMKSSYWDINAYLKGMLLKNLFLLADLPSNIGGYVYGKITYDSNSNGYARIQLKNFSYLDYYCDTAQVFADMTSEYFDLSYFSLHSGKGTITGNAFIGLNPYWGSSSSNILFYKFPLKNRIINGKIGVKGNIFSEKEVHFIGNVDGSGIKINSWTANNLKALIDATKESIDIKSFKIDETVNGKIYLNIFKKVLKGVFSFTNFNINGIYDDLKGVFNGNFSIKGNFENPNIDFTFSMPNAEYKEYSLSCAASLHYKDNILSGERISISSGTSNIFLEGKIWPKLSLNGSIGYLSTSLIGNLLNKEIPLGGGFSGLMNISNSFGNPDFSAHLKGVGLYYKSLAIPEWNSKILLKNGNLNIEYLDIKFSDSEILLSNGSSIYLKDNKFKVKTKLRNVHAWPFTVFGGVNLKGEFYKKNQKYGIKGILGTDDLWINQHNAARTFLGFDIYESTVTFGNYSKITSIATGSMSLNKWPRILFNKLELNQKGKSFEIDGILGFKKSDFIVTTKNLPGSTLSEIVELPVNIEGPINSIITGKGSIDKPHVVGNIVISSGSFAEMPFNKLTMNFHIKDDVLKIYDSGLAHKDKYLATIDGFVPFSMTKVGAKRILGNKVGLTLAIEKEKLTEFNGLLEDISFAKGDLEIKLNLAGTLSKPTWNGILKVSNGEINSRRYFKKFKDLNIDLSLKNNLLKINEFSGKIGSGLNRLTGSVIFEGFKPKKFDLNWKTEKNQGISISVPQLPIPTPLVKTDEWSLFSSLSHGDPKFDLRFYGPMDKLMLSGWVEMENTRFSYPSLLKSEERGSMLDVLWPIMSLDIELRSGKNSWYDNELASINIGGSIRLTGKADNPKVNGKIEALRGVISYFGSEFNVKQALLEIVNDAVYLEAEASCDVYLPGQSIPDTITMTIDRAEISKIQPRFSSKDNQDLTSEKALSRAARMDPSTYEGPDRDFLMRRQLIRVVDSSLATPIARNILRKSGLVDQFNVQYVDKNEAKPANPNQPSMVDLLYGTKYSMEKYLTNQVLFGYSLIFDKLQDKLAFRHELELSYKWTRNIFLKGSYEPANKDLGTEGERKISIEQMFRFGGSTAKKKKKRII